MTSRNLFFRAMGEDLRHKLWTAAISFLGNFLVLPVGWMVWRSEALRRGGVEAVLSWGENDLQEFLNEAVMFFVRYLTVGGGMVAMAVAVMTGLSVLRHVHNRKMTDTYHSLPIKRNTLYGVRYLEGFLIWIIPFLVNVLAMFLLACSLFGQLGAVGRIPELAGELLLTVAVLILVYLQVYHAALLSVMLCGNMLNTLFSMMVLGFGPIGLYGLWVAFSTAYLSTFYASAMIMEPAAGLSPLFAGPWLIALWMDVQEGIVVKGEGRYILIMVIQTALVGAAAWQLYPRRASEAAEQGIWSRKVAAVFRALTGIAAGMCGWGFFAALLTVSGAALGWNIFGAVLGAVGVYGVLDIMFQMDFKAFFSHKAQMAGTVAAALLICFAFYGDWFGYDAYLPDREKIVSVSVLDTCLANRSFYGGFSDKSPAEEMCYQDRDALYAFLERMTEHERTEIWEGEREGVTVKVTLDSGRSYYREYWMLEEDRDLAWPLFTSEEYMRYAYLIEEEEIGELRSFSLDLGTGPQYLKTDGPEVRAMIRAYNQDVLENREAVLAQQGKRLGEAAIVVRFRMEGRERDEDITIGIYDYMDNTRKAIEEAGYREFGLEEMMVESIVLPFGYYCEGMTPGERVAAAREQYGVLEAAEQKSLETQDDFTEQESHASGFGQETAEAVSIRDPKAGEEVCDVYITDPGEMEEVFGLLCFGSSAWRSGGIFGKQFTQVSLLGADGRTWEGFIPLGALPEKYILRFGE